MAVSGKTGSDSSVLPPYCGYKFLSKTFGEFISRAKVSLDGLRKKISQKKISFALNSKVLSLVSCNFYAKTSLEDDYIFENTESNSCIRLNKTAALFQCTESALDIALHTVMKVSEIDTRRRASTNTVSSVLYSALNNTFRRITCLDHWTEFSHLQVSYSHVLKMSCAKLSKAMKNSDVQGHCILTQSPGVCITKDSNVNFPQLCAAAMKTQKTQPLNSCAYSSGLSQDLIPKALNFNEIKSDDRLFLCESDNVDQTFAKTQSLTMESNSFQPVSQHKSSKFVSYHSCLESSEDSVDPELADVSLKKRKLVKRLKHIQQAAKTRDFGLSDSDDSNVSRHSSQSSVEDLVKAFSCLSLSDSVVNELCDQHSENKSKSMCVTERKRQDEHYRVGVVSVEDDADDVMKFDIASGCGRVADDTGNQSTQPAADVEPTFCDVKTDDKANEAVDNDDLTDDEEDTDEEIKHEGFGEKKLEQKDEESHDDLTDDDLTDDDLTDDDLTDDDVTDEEEADCELTYNNGSVAGAETDSDSDDEETDKKQRKGNSSAADSESNKTDHPTYKSSFFISPSELDSSDSSSEDEDEDEDLEEDGWSDSSNIHDFNALQDDVFTSFGRNGLCFTHSHGSPETELNLKELATGQRRFTQLTPTELDNSCDDIVFDDGQNTGSFDTEAENDEVDGVVPNMSYIESINIKWNQMYYGALKTDAATVPNEKRKTVRFAREPVLVVTYHESTLEAEDYAAARKGPWEEYARDRDRFSRRIRDAEERISWVFCPDHRNKVYTHLLSKTIQ